MAYKKFDDASLDVNQAPRKLYEAFPVESVRRAILSISNRVVGAALGGTGGSIYYSGLGTGATEGISIGNPIIVLLNGRMATRGTGGHYALPAGTQTTLTVVKYLVAVGTGTSGTVVAGNEGTGSTTALLPDCPDGMVAVGYFQYTAGTCGWNRGANRCTGQTGSAGTGTFTELIHMPLYET